MKDSGTRAYGMVLTFNDRHSAQQARRLLVEANLIAPLDRQDMLVGSPDAIHEYNPDHGGPVWYLP